MLQQWVALGGAGGGAGTGGVGWAGGGAASLTTAPLADSKVDPHISTAMQF